jgi:hypothetical protein
MASSFEIDFPINYGYENTQDLGSARYAENTSNNFKFTIGTGDDSVDTIYRDKLELRTGNLWSIDYDLTALVDAFGVTKNFSKIKALYIRNASDGTTLVADIAVLEDATNDFKASIGTAVGSDLTIAPLDIFQQTKRKTGWTVDGTNKILRITAGVATTSADDADIDVVIVGVAT